MNNDAAPSRAIWSRAACLISAIVALRSRFAVVDRGTVVATGTPPELVESDTDGVSVTFAADSAALGVADDLRHLPGVTAVERQGTSVAVNGDPSMVAPVGKVLVEHGLTPSDIEVVRPTLEDVYLRLVSGQEA